MKIDETATLNPFKPQAVKSYWGRPVSRRRRSQSGRPLRRAVWKCSSQLVKGSEATLERPAPCRLPPGAFELFRVFLDLKIDDFSTFEKYFFLNFCVPGAPK